MNSDVSKFFYVGIIFDYDHLLQLLIFIHYGARFTVPDQNRYHHCYAEFTDLYNVRYYIV